VVQRRKIFEILPSGELPINAAFARKDRAQAAPDVIGLFDNIEAVDLCGAARGLEQGTEHADRGGFTGSIRAEQTEDLAALDLQVHAIDRGEHSFGFFPGEKPAFLLWGMGTVFVACAGPSRKLLD
jgi:hypothetical protein